MCDSLRNVSLCQTPVHTLYSYFFIRESGSKMAFFRCYSGLESPESRLHFFHVFWCGFLGGQWPQMHTFLSIWVEGCRRRTDSLVSLYGQWLTSELLLCLNLYLQISVILPKHYLGSLSAELRAATTQLCDWTIFGTFPLELHRALATNKTAGC